MFHRTVFEIQADLCRSMSNAIRIEIIHVLRDGPKRVGEISNLTGHPQPMISRHLGVLHSSGIITSEQQGQSVVYQIANPKIAEICDLMRGVLMEDAAHRSDLLKAIEGQQSE